MNYFFNSYDCLFNSLFLKLYEAYGYCYMYILLPIIMSFSVGERVEAGG